MPLSDNKIDSIRSNLSNPTSPLDDIQQNVTSAISDPFGKVITKSFTKINSLVANIENKIDKLTKDVAAATDSKGRVTLENNSLVITITKEDERQAQAIKTKVEARVESIRRNIVTLSTLLKSLGAIQTAMSTLQTALTIQETVLSLNPTTGPIFTVFKKAIKIVFLKDMIKQYSATLKTQIQANTRTLNALSDKFKNLQVSIKIQDEANKGTYIGAQDAEKLIVQDLLDTKQNSDIETISEDFTSYSGKTYILKVEKYGEKQLVGRAYEKISGLLEEQTAPSFFTSPGDLILELQTILNLK